ncbi:hypothetical protein ACFLT7_06005 [candidate division KSB1 bacterium]
MAKPYFQSGATTYTFDYAEILPVEEEDIPLQIVGRTETGKKLTTDLGGYIRAWMLQWGCNSDGSLAGLKVFLRTTVNFAETAFTYVDSAGNSYTVRIMDPRVLYRTPAPGRHRGIFYLEEEKT